MTRRLATLLLGVLVPAAAAADTIRASLLVMDPGGAYFSCTGHAALRMESEEFKLDRCFSYESEPMGCLLGRFLAGRLKMGMFRVPTAVFLEPYRMDRRGVRAYRLDLPQDVLRELWLVLDEKVEEGVRLPYDYLKRGCAQSVLECLTAAAARRNRNLSFPAEKPYYHMTCREAFARSIPNHPWTLCFLHLVGGTDVDEDGPPLSHVKVPADLLDLLQSTTMDGRRVIGDEGVRLLPFEAVPERPWITPLAVSIVILFAAVVAVICPFRKFRLIVTSAVLTLCALIGLVTSYTVFCTSLPGTTWNWLIVPFNPLLVLLWKWHRKWAIPYGVAIVAWVTYMLCAPHGLTHPAYLCLSAALLAILYRGRPRAQ